jgi:hypothetical protein
VRSLAGIWGCSERGSREGAVPQREHFNYISLYFIIRDAKKYLKRNRIKLHSLRLAALRENFF